MANRANVEMAIRKAMESQLKGARTAMRAVVPVETRGTQPYQDPEIFPIWWPNHTFYGTKDESKPPFYVRFSHHPVEPRFRSVGDNPRMLSRGHSLVGCFVPEGAGEDLVDQLANAVAAAYPISGPESILTRDGFDIHIENVDPKPAFGSLGRYYKPVHIIWNCWRTSPNGS